MLYKDANGWRASDSFDLGNKLELEVYTRKCSSGHLDSYARVDKVDGRWKSHRVYQDFTKHIERTSVRVTERAVRLQHERVMQQIDEILAQAKAHYTKEAA